MQIQSFSTYIKSNVGRFFFGTPGGNYVLISKEQHCRSPVKKLEEEKTRLQGWEETPRYGETKTYFNKPSEWLKRMILRDPENVFVFEFGPIVPVVLKCLF